MQLPMSKYEKSLLKKLKKIFDTGDSVIEIDAYDDQELSMFIDDMLDRRIIMSVSSLSGAGYIKNGDINLYLKQLIEEDRKARKLSRREWIIAIVSVLLGAVATEAIQMLVKVITNA